MAVDTILATLSDAEASALVTLTKRLVAGGLTEDAANAYGDDLAMARMLTVLDGLAQALSGDQDGGATATAALAAARTAVTTAKATVTSLRSSGGDVAAGQAAVVTAAQAVGTAAQAVGAWAQAIAAAIPQG